MWRKQKFTAGLGAPNKWLSLVLGHGNNVAVSTLPASNSSSNPAGNTAGNSVADEAINSCDVALLVPHPSMKATLLCESPMPDDHSVRLPGVQVRAEAEIVDIIRGIEPLTDGLTGRVVPLRLNAVAWYDNFDASAVMVEIEPPGAEIPERFTWRRIERSHLDAISPEWVRDSVRAWLDEQDTGWSDLRPQWSRPGWLSLVSPWMTEQMRAAGYVDPQEPRVHHIWGVSVVLAAGSQHGTAYLKCSGDRFRTEAVVTQALAQRSPALLPEVVAVEPDHGWLLMRDLGGPHLGDRPHDDWSRGMDALAQLQQQWMGKTDELLALGAERRSLADLVTWVEGTIDDHTLLDKLPDDGRDAWLAALPSMVEKCWRLQEIGPDPTLVHGDFHPWNVIDAHSGPRIFDWTDASVALPFLDAATYVMRSSSEDEREHLMSRYLGHWSEELPGRDSEELTHLALVVGALHQAHTYAQLIPTIMPADLSDLRDGDGQWLERALRFESEGLRAPY